MDKINNAIHKTAKKLVKNAFTPGPLEWPPSCLIITYQPERPQTGIRKEASKAK